MLRLIETEPKPRYRIKSADSCDSQDGRHRDSQLCLSLLVVFILGNLALEREKFKKRKK